MAGKDSVGPTQPIRVETRERILDAAAEVMGRLGLVKATTKEIALAAAFSEAAIYKHFKDKDDLYFCVLTERLPNYVRPLRELAAKPNDRPLKAQLEEVAKAALRFYTQSLPITVPLLGEPLTLARHRARMVALNRGPEKADEAVAAYLRVEQQGGRVHGAVNADVAATFLVGACFRRVFLASYHGQKMTPREMSRTASDIVTTLLLVLDPTNSAALKQKDATPSG